MGFNFHAVCPWEHTSYPWDVGGQASDREGAVPPPKALHGYKPLIICFLSASCRLQWTELPAG